MTKIVSKVVTHLFNGNVDNEEKFVEVDGKKFVDDGTGKAKVDDKGLPIPFVEKKVDEKIDLATLDLEKLAKVNPHVAKMLSEKEEADKKLSDADKLRQEKERKDAEAKGEWQKIADQEKIKRTELEKELEIKKDLLTKYAVSVETILKEIMATIPKENLALIPEKFSSREKLEYITANAKLLGAKINASKGDGVDKNDVNVSGTEEEKLVAEIDALVKKGATRTAVETSDMYAKSKKLAELRKVRLEKKS